MSEDKMIGEKPTTWEWRAGYDYATEKYKDEIDRLRAAMKDRLVLLEDAYAQRDRLRADLEHYAAISDQFARERNDWIAEADRLRAENAELRGIIGKYAEECPPSVRAILAKTSRL